MDLMHALEVWARVSGRAPATVKSYRTRLLRFAARGMRTVADVTCERVGAFVDEVVLAGRSGSSVNIDLCALSVALRHARSRAPEAERARFSTLLAAIWEMRIPVPERTEPPTFYDAEEYAAMLEVLAPHPWARRAFVLACWTGLRRGELVRLRGEHVDRERKTLRIVGPTKGHRVRVVPLAGAALAALEDAPREGFIFPSLCNARTTTGHVGSKALWAHFKAAGRSLGINATPHRCRRTFITNALRSGMIQSDVQRIVDHKSREQLDAYEAWFRGYIADIERVTLTRRQGT